MLFYGLPGLPLAALTLPLYVYLPVLYADERGIGFFEVGVALLIVRLSDMATDPLIGAASDRWRSRWGRRRPWMALGAPLLLISVWALFAPPERVDLFYLLGWSLLFHLAATMVTLPYQAWGAELTGDYDGRSRVTAAREVFVVIGTLLAVGAPAALGAGPEEATTVIAWGLTLALPLSVLLIVLRVPEPAVRRPRSLTLRQGLRLLARNGPFRRLLLAYFLNGVAGGLPAGLFLLFVDRVLMADAGWQGRLLFLYFACAVAVVPFWLWLSRRWGKHRAWIAGMAAASMVFAAVPFLGPGDLIQFAVICVLTGACLGADLVLPPSMQADVIDLDTLRSGEPRTGVFFALWGVATKLALAVAIGAAFPILDLVGLETGPEATGTQGVWALLVLYALAPVAFKLCAVVIMWGYPIDAARHKRIRAAITRRAGEIG